ncbi:MAG: HAD hydrolase-like protein [Elusimicrobia bacterium]|nr:HAD hydrolase-like protein [Elusimicrobiota bacterium]
MKIVLFDIDGTLIKAGGAGGRALDKVIKDMFGVEHACDKVSWQGCTDKENFSLVFKYASGKKPSARQFREMELQYLNLLPAEVKRSIRSGNYSRLNGAEKFLAKLSGRRDVLVGLGTGNLKDGAFIKLEPSGLLKHFAFGGYGCDSRHRSEVLEKAVERAGRLAGVKISPREVFVIGDTHRDVEAAKEAGYHSAAVLEGFGDRRLIMRSNPELLAKDFSRLKPWLIWLGLEKDPKGVRRGTYICPDSPIEHAHYGRTGLDLRDIELGMKRLREARKKVKGRGK